MNINTKCPRPCCLGDDTFFICNCHHNYFWKCACSRRHVVVHGIYIDVEMVVFFTYIMKQQIDRPQAAGDVFIGDASGVGKTGIFNFQVSLVRALQVPGKQDSLANH